jgi:CMP-N,N'-diacetyllegionaminic acid synthase
MRIYVLIPARAGSKRLPHKNVRPLGGHPMMAYAIAFGQSLGIDRVIVSTDSPDYRDIALRYGAECPVLRSAAASTDTAMEEDVIADLDRTLPAAGVPLPDIWIWVKPTSLFRHREATLEGLEKLKADRSLHSVRLVTRADCRLHQVDDSGYLRPWTPGWGAQRSKMRRSEFAETYAAHNIAMFRHDGWRERGPNYLGTVCMPIYCEAITAFDLDSLDDFEMASALIDARPLPDVVARHIAVPHLRVLAQSSPTASAAS